MWHWLAIIEGNTGVRREWKWVQGFLGYSGFGPYHKIKENENSTITKRVSKLMTHPLETFQAINDLKQTVLL